MRILVTGGAGFIGSHLVDRLVAEGHQVAVVDDCSTGFRTQVCEGASFHEISICGNGLEAAFQAAEPEAVFHLAAQTSVVRSLRDPSGDAEINIQGTLRVLQQSVARGVRRFIFSSTGGAIYGDPATLPATEAYLPRPSSPYGVSKLAAESYVAAICPASGIRFAALRYGNVYGPRQDPFGEAGVIAIFANAMITGTRPVIFGDGNQERDYVFVDDAVEANLLALAADRDGVFNIGTGEGTSVQKIFETIAAETHYRGQPAHAPERPGEVKRIHLDAGYAARVLDWRPRVPLADGLRRTIKSFPN